MKQSPLVSDLVRVYFNKGAAAPLVWSVDCGPGTPEMLAVRVHIDHKVVSRYEPEQGDNVTTPRAWFECRNRVTVIPFENGLIVIE